MSLCALARQGSRYQNACSCDPAVVAGSQDNPDRRSPAKVEVKYIIDKPLCIGQVTLKMLYATTGVANSKLRRA